jgi:hypothetical protein
VLDLQSSEIAIYIAFDFGSECTSMHTSYQYMQDETIKERAKNN